MNVSEVAIRVEKGENNNLNSDDIPIWDSHVHLFPPEIYRNWEKYAQKDQTFALLTKTDPDGKRTQEAWVDYEEAIACADEAGVYGLCMQGWYWNDEGLMREHNDYMAEAIRRHPDRLKGFISVNPKFGWHALAEIERCERLGFSGIGELGPGGNGYDFTDPDFLAVLEMARTLQLPVCIHCGEQAGHSYPGKDTTSLAPIPEIVKTHPDLKLILAHLGGGMPFYEMNRHFRDRFSNVRYDMAANPLLYDIRILRAVIDLVGAHRLFFGSDFPLLLYPSKCRKADMKLFLEDLDRNAGFSEEERKQIMGRNFLSFIKNSVDK